MDILKYIYNILKKKELFIIKNYKLIKITSFLDICPQKSFY